MTSATPNKGGNRPRHSRRLAPKNQATTTGFINKKAGKKPGKREKACIQSLEQPECQPLPAPKALGAGLAISYQGKSGQQFHAINDQYNPWILPGSVV